MHFIFQNLTWVHLPCHHHLHGMVPPPFYASTAILPRTTRGLRCDARAIPPMCTQSRVRLLLVRLIYDARRWSHRMALLSCLPRYGYLTPCEPSRTGSTTQTRRVKGLHGLCRWTTAQRTHIRAPGGLPMAQALQRANSARRVQGRACPLTTGFGMPGAARSTVTTKTGRATALAWAISTQVTRRAATCTWAPHHLIPRTNTCATICTLGLRPV